MNYPEPEISLPLLMIAAGERTRLALAHESERRGITLPLARALMALSKPMPMTELSEVLGYDRSHITGLANRLEDAGYVVRVSSETDHRTLVIVLTPAGEKTRDDLAAAVLGNVASTLTPAEIIDAKRVFDRVAHAE